MLRFRRRASWAFLLSYLLVLDVRGLVAQAPADSPPPQFPGGVELVTVDVVVLEKGQPVRGLTQDDFVVLEDDRPQAIASFEAVEVPEAPATPAPAPLRRTRVTTNLGPPPPPGRSFVLVFDNVHLSPTQAEQAKKAVADFLRTGLREGDQVQFVATGGGSWWTARMNSGQADLLAALERVKGLRPALVGPDHVSDFEALRIHQHRDQRLGAEVSRRFYENGVLADTFSRRADAAARQLRAEITGEGHPLVRIRAADVYTKLHERQQASLRSLKRVLDGLAGGRGRKTVIMVSEGFVHDPQEAAFAEVTNAARRANAAIYFLDARLASGSESSAAELGRALDLRDLGTTLDKHVQEASGAISIAADTGGERLGTAATLADNLRRVAGESRAYYLLGYAPADARRDGRFRAIKVQVKRPGVQVRARRGYHAPKEGAAPAPRPDALDPEVQRSLDSPFASQAIPLRLAAYVLGPADAGKTKVMIVAEADARAFAFAPKDGRHTDVLETVFLVSSRTGENFHHQSRLDLSLPPEARAQLERSWLPVQRPFDLPAGVYQAHFALKDQNKGQAGSVVHEFEVEDPSRFRVTTPVLTDTLLAGQGDPRPALLARRTFAAGSRLYGQFEVYGARPDPVTGQPRVSAGHVLRRTDGAVLSKLNPTPVPPNPQGQLSRLLAISLRTATAGTHELVLTVRDEVANTAVELTEPFTVEGTAPPAPPPPVAAAPALNVPPGTAGYQQLIGSYRQRPVEAALGLARWPAAARQEAAQGLRKQPDQALLLPAALLHTEAAFAQPGREREDLEAARTLLELTADPAEREDLVQRWLIVVGQRLRNASRLEEAAHFLEEARKRRPQDPAAHLALGSIHELVAMLGLTPAGRSEASAFGQGGQPVGSESLGKFQAQAEREKRARLAQDHYRAALAADPTLQEARLRLGRLAHQLGRENEALDHLTQVVKAETEPAIRLLAHLFLGDVHESAGRLEAAVSHYRKAREADPGSQTAALALSHALGRSGQRAQAAEVLRAALSSAGSSNVWVAYHVGFPSRHEAALRQLREKVRP